MVASYSSLHDGHNNNNTDKGDEWIKTTALTTLTLGITNLENNANSNINNTPPPPPANDSSNSIISSSDRITDPLLPPQQRKRRFQAIRNNTFTLYRRPTEEQSPTPSSSSSSPSLVSTMMKCKGGWILGGFVLIVVATTTTSTTTKAVFVAAADSSGSDSGGSSGGRCDTNNNNQRLFQCPGQDEACPNTGISLVENCFDCPNHYNTYLPDQECFDRKLLNSKSNPSSSYLWRDIVGIFVWFIAAGLATAAGVGGGGIYVPLGILLLAFAPKPSSGLSQASIFGASLGGLLLNMRDKHPFTTKQQRVVVVGSGDDEPSTDTAATTTTTTTEELTSIPTPDKPLPSTDDGHDDTTSPANNDDDVNVHIRYYTRPLIDYDMALFLAPMEMAGAVLGVLIQRILPNWLYLMISAIILGYTANKTYRKWWTVRSNEQRKDAVAAVSDIVNGGVVDNDDNDAAGAAAREVDERDRDQQQLPSSSIGTATMTNINGKKPQSQPPSSERIVNNDDDNNNKNQNNNNNNEINMSDNVELVEEQEDHHHHHHRRYDHNNDDGHSHTDSMGGSCSSSGGDDDVHDVHVDDEEDPSQPSRDQTANTTTTTSPTSTIIPRPLTSEQIERRTELLDRDARQYPREKLCTFVVLWIGLTLLTFLKGGKGVESFIGITCHDVWYGILIGFQFVWTFGFAAYFGWKLMKETTEKKDLQYPFHPQDVLWDFPKTRFYAFFTFVAGIVAGLIGIGGGMVLGPLMLVMGIHPRVSTATTATMIVLTSSSVAVLFVTSGLVPWEYAVCFFLVCFCGALIGKFYIDGYVKRTGKASILIFLLATIIAFATIGTIVIVLTRLADANWCFAGFNEFCKAPTEDEEVTCKPSDRLLQLHETYGETFYNNVMSST